MTESAFTVRSKVWIVDPAGEVVLGLGRLRILQAVQRHGSIQAAAAELKMGYRAVWGRIKATEDRLGQALLVRNIGGTTGGGSRLTPFAEALVQSFEEMHREVNDEADGIFATHFSRILSHSKLPPPR
jgi:molybdate transport system regulatory protein